MSSGSDEAKAPPPSVSKWLVVTGNLKGDSHHYCGFDFSEMKLPSFCMIAID